MDERNNSPREPWERDSYETGRTKPPKSRRGITALLLIAVIFLGGITSALGIMNIKLFRQLKEQSGDAGMSFHEATNTPTTPTEATNPKDHTESDVEVELNKTPESVENVPQTGGLSYQEIYDKAIDSVVSITCDNGTGTGVVLTRDGYLVTNCHVVQGAQTIQVLFTDGRTMGASVVGADTVSDLAVLYVQAKDLTPAEFGDSSALRVGDAVAAIGDPLGSQFRGTMTDGIVSAINRDVTTNGRTMTLIQTNAALNSGNSGGPLLNCYGQVVGINTLKIGAFTDSAGVEGLGFAIPSTTVKEVVEQLISQGYVSGRPSLGISGSTVSRLEQAWYQLPAGVLIQQVTPGSNAEKAGLAKGDVLIGIDDVRIADAQSLETALYAYDAGDTVKVVIYRNHRQYSVTMTLDEAEG